MALRSSICWNLFLASAFTLGACDGSVESDEQAPPDETEDTEETGETRFRVTVSNNSAVHPFLSSGVVAVREGSTSPGPLFPGDQYKITFAASPGDHLSLATMMVQSNDLFFSMGQWGVPLFDGRDARESIELTSDIKIYDAGTEANEELGTGATQAPRQSGPDDGALDPNSNVRIATNSEFPNLPAVSSMIGASVTYEGDGLFELTVYNSSNSTTLSHSNGTSAVPLAPVALTVHRDPANPLFTLGQPDRGEGLELLAESGSPALLGQTLAAQSGVTSPISPGAFAVHSGAGVIFNDGNADRGQGLEALAEAGSPVQLVETLSGRSDVSMAGAFNTVAGAEAPGPAFPGQSYEFDITASPGDRLSLATMYIQSNDLFVSFGDAGLELFTGSTPISGDVSAQLQLLDAGTEINEIPGAGPTQAPRQSEADAGAAELGVVEMVDDRFENPAAWDIVRVTVTAI